MTNDELNRELTLFYEGDKTAFERIYTELNIPALTIILRITQNKALSEDILQELFVKLYCSPPKTSVLNPRAYIFQMTRNLAIDELKKQPKTVNIDDCEEPAQNPWANYAEQLDIENAMYQLSLDERQIVALHINGNLKFREIASITNIPLGTVLWKYQKAMKRLRILLDGGAL